MSNDQERFYEDEEQEVRDQEFEEEREDELEDVDDMKYFMELLKHIRVAIRSGANVPLTSKKIVDADKCLMIIDDLERNLPDAVQYGMQMFTERDRILGNAETAAMNRVSSAEMRANAALEKARADAEQIVSDAESEAHAILADAQERADRMVDENEIVRRAREEARIIKNDARVEASELRLKASHDAYQLLSSVEDDLNDAAIRLRNRRAELDDEEE